MVLIRTRGSVVSRALLATALGVAWLSVGCGDGGKSDTQIEAAPEAAAAAQAASKNISENMAKKYSNKGANKTQ